jgi:hypothetical protein
MTSLAWFIGGIVLGAGLATYLFLEYKARMTQLMESLEAKFERIVNIISGWQKDIKK